MSTDGEVATVMREAVVIDGTTTIDATTIDATTIDATTIDATTMIRRLLAW